MHARRYIFPGVLATVAVLGGALLVLDLSGVDTVRLVRDVTATAALDPWTGFFSTLGLLIWAAAAGACVLTGGVLARDGDARAAFFLTTGALVSYLAIDDAYLIHEGIAPDEFAVPERGVELLIYIAVLAWAWRFRRELIRSDRRLLALAVVGFAGSVVTDIASDHLHALEDGLKLTGIVALAAWCFDDAVRALERREARP